MVRSGQAQFAALRIGREIHPLADVLPGQVEERLGWLQDRGLDPDIAGTLESIDERLRGGIGRCRFGRGDRHQTSRSGLG